MRVLYLTLSTCIALAVALEFARCESESSASIAQSDESIDSDVSSLSSRPSRVSMRRQILATRSSSEWRRFKRRYAKIYSDELEEERRVANYLGTKKLIEAHNSSPNRSYTLELNDLADLSSREVQQMTGFLGASSHQPLAGWAEGVTFVSEVLKRNPDKDLDWRDYGSVVVPPVREQGTKCGACWSFTTAALLESQQYRLSVANTTLSNQQLLDCERGRSRGCDGGYLDAALDYVRWNGIQSHDTYPYQETQSQHCKAKPSEALMRGGVPIPISAVGEDNFRKFLTWYGPIAVAINASHPDFKSWKSGVYNGCNPRSAADHSVLLVGYGSDTRFGPYWIIRNSWGTDWGENGFAKIKRGVNMCRIAEHAYIYKLNWALYFPKDNVRHYQTSAEDSKKHQNVLRHLAPHAFSV